MPVDEVGGITVGLGDAVDELAEGAGLDFVGVGFDELSFAAGADVELEAADVVGLHDVPSPAGVVGVAAAEVSFKLPGPPPVF